MTHEDDRLGEALRRVASGAGPRRDLAGAALSTARRRRMAAATGSAAALVVVLAGGVAAVAATRSPQREPLAVAPASPSASSTPSVSVVITPSSSMPAVSPMPTATASPKPAPNEAASPDVRSSQPTQATEPATAPSAEVSPPAAEPTTQPKPGPGLTASLEPPAAAQAGRATRLQAHVTDTDGNIISARVEYGDGQSRSINGASTSCSGPQGPYRAQPSDETLTFDVTYAKAGTYTAVLTVTTGGGCQATPQEKRRVTVQVRVQESPDPSPTMGSPAPGATSGLSDTAAQ